jgi:hypothetical protein
MPQNIWTIHPTPGGGSNGNDLTGCHIQQTATGYQLTAPNITNPLATTTATSFDFDNVSYQNSPEHNVTTLRLMPMGKMGHPRHWSGRYGSPVWDYTAQSGSGVDADVDEAASPPKRRNALKVLMQCTADCG